MRGIIPNVSRARDYMERHGVRAVLASSPTNVAYFTGFECWLYEKYTEDVLVIGAQRARKEAFSLLAESGDIVLVTDSYSSLFAWELVGVELLCYGSPLAVSGKGSRSPHARFFRDALSSQKQTPAEALAAALRLRGVTSGKVAVEADSIRPETLRSLKREFPRIEFLDGWLLIRLIRMAKSETEVRLLTSAARVNERALYQSLGSARAGVRIGDLARRDMVEMSSGGAVFDHYFNSPDGLWLSGAMKYRLRLGEYTIMDSGCTFERYNADMGTTILVGRRRQGVERRYREIWESVDEIADSIEPGTTSSEATKRFGRFYANRNITGVDYSGHGIGLEPREYPIMGPGGPKAIRDGIVRTTTDMPFEPGMVISLETSLYEPGEGSFEVERTFLVGKSKLKELTTRRDPEIFVTEP